MLAAGGILAEIHRDRSLRLAPVDLAEAQAMIGEVAALKALAGYRGRPPAISTRWRRRWWRCRGLRSRTAPPSPRPRSIR